MAISKGHEQRRSLEAHDSRTARLQGVNLHPRASIGQDYESIARIERLSKLPSGQPLFIQDPATGLFQFLAGIDGPLSGGS